MPGCQTVGQSVERIAESDVECEAVVQAEWGDGAGEFGYVPDDQPSFYLRRPFHFQVDSAGNIYVVDLHNERVLAFTPEGALLNSFSVPISEDREFILDVAVGSSRIAVATTDYVYVFDQDDGSSEILEWPAEAGRYIPCSAKSIIARRVQVDEEGNIYVCSMEEEMSKILQFDRQGHSREFFVGVFDHIIAGWDGFVYVERIGYMNLNDGVGPYDSVLKFDLEGNKVGEIVIYEHDLNDAGLVYPGLLVAVDAKSNLYGTVVHVLRNDEITSQEALVKISAEGKILRIIEREHFQYPSFDVIDREGNFYIWHFAEVPSEPEKIWRCSP
jgi:hypothetical protein